MGCTSSAPNMADLQTDATENTEINQSNGRDETINSEPERNVIILENKKNVEALPLCDTFNENIQLDGISKSSDIETNADCTAKEILEDVTQNNETEDEKITTFKDVADKVLEEIHTQEFLEETEKKDEHKDETINEMDVLAPTDTHFTESITEDDIIVENIEDNENKEHVSPSQSECSRSTRWEALADIAAELPPSLAVDPVTGQIYSLTK